MKSMDARQKVSSNASVAPSTGERERERERERGGGGEDKGKEGKIEKP